MSTKEHTMWKCIYRPTTRGDTIFPDGHKLFRDDSGRISICDWSGDTPDQTDDGPLIVKEDRPITARLYNGKMAYIVDVLVTRTREAGVVWLDHTTMVALSKHANVKVIFSDELVKLCQQIEWAKQVGCLTPA